MSLDWNLFEAVSFDCYGTLVDWERGLLDALQPILSAHGREASDEELLEAFATAESKIEAGAFQMYRGVLRDVLERLGNRYEFEPTDEELKAFSTSVGDWPAFDDSADVLAALKRNYQLCVLTNSDNDQFNRTARGLGLEFDLVLTAEKVESYKPNPRHFEQMIERVEVPGPKILHVAQSLYHDIEPARELGLATVWINRRWNVEGPGATPRVDVEPDVELPDLATLGMLMGVFP